MENKGVNSSTRCIPSSHMKPPIYQYS
uniref:Uncharacterized protein n=1 Tax=Arundo donax TaxID=35708 RepID=A0A0A9HF20_ARUDO